MKTKTIFGITLVLGSILAFGTSASAATYQYVNVSGNIQSIDAANASLALASAVNIDPHSGVILYTPANAIGSAIGGDNSGVSLNTYEYVDTSGQVRSVTASNPSEAMSIAPNKDPDSGVILVDATHPGV